MISIPEQGFYVRGQILSVEQKEKFTLVKVLVLSRSAELLTFVYFGKEELPLGNAILSISTPRVRNGFLNLVINAVEEVIS